MFYDREDCIKVSFFPDDYGTQSGVFLFKGFYTDEECKVVEDALKNYDKGMKHKDTLISWYSEKVSPVIPGLFDLWEKASEMLYPDYVIHPQANVLIITPEMNEGMFTHSDSPGKGECHRLSQVDVWKTCCDLDFGLVAYFGDFEGGEIFYVNIDKDGNRNPAVDTQNRLSIKPERGDLVIHGAFDPHSHGVMPVSKGKRYAFSNFVLKAEDNPGTFHNYKSPEYYSELVDRESPDFNEFIKKWLKPLKENPQFTPERIKEYQASGLEGTELSDKFMGEFKEHKGEN
jgi:hypothetical protein